MLDGKRYYEAFPDEKPTLSSLHALLRILEKLEGGIQEVCRTIGRGRCTRDRSERAKRRISAVINPDESTTTDRRRYRAQVQSVLATNRSSVSGAYASFIQVLADTLNDG
jgi:hypothetical protein